MNHNKIKKIEGVAQWWRAHLAYERKRERTNVKQAGRRLTNGTKSQLVLGTRVYAVTNGI